MVTFATSYYSETHATHLFWCKYGRARTRQQKTILLHSLIEQAQGSADKERPVRKLYDWTKPQGDAAPAMRCAMLDVVSWFHGVLQQLWMDVSVRCPQDD